MQKYYRHTQFGTVLVVAFTLSIIVVAGILSKYGWHPLSTLVFAVLILCIFLFFSLSVEISNGVIKCRFGIGPIKKVFDLAEIIDVKTVVNKWYYGWGIRLTPHGWLYNVSGMYAVEITLRSGKKYRIGTDEPDRLAEAIRDNIKM